MIRRRGSIKQYSGQGVEKNNDAAKQYSGQGVEKNNDAAKQNYHASNKLSIDDLLLFDKRLQRLSVGKTSTG